jgi:hypothetical protein
MKEADVPLKYIRNKHISVPIEKALHASRPKV